MASAGPCDPYVPASVTRSAKIVVSGAFGVGKTTLVSSVAQIKVLTEAPLTEAGTGVDHLTGIPHKTTTTVSMDYGRLHLDDKHVLYLVGTPGQDRFRSLWDGLLDGALGALVLVDVRRLDDCHGILTHLEQHDLPYAVAVNEFPGAPQHPMREIREALDLPPGTPLIACDARERTSSLQALIALVQYLITLDARTESPQ